MNKKFYTIKVGKTNSYLLPCEKGYLLIDTGYEKDYDNFIKALKQRHIDISEIKYLLLTHHHDDHSGFTNRLISKTELRIIAHRKSVELLKTGENDKKRGGGYINRRIYYLSKLYKLLNPEWSLSFPPVYLRCTDIIVDGDDDKVLRDIGIQGKILYTPGHTIDSISVLLDEGTLFCGDAAMSWPLWAGIKYCTIFITDIEGFYSSWDKMISAGAKIILPSHGAALGADKLKENLHKYQQDDLVRFF